MAWVFAVPMVASVVLLLVGSITGNVKIRLLHLRPALRPTDVGWVSRRREWQQALPALDGR